MFAFALLCLLHYLRLPLFLAVLMESPASPPAAHLVIHLQDRRWNKSVGYFATRFRQFPELYYRQFYPTVDAALHVTPAESAVSAALSCFQSEQVLFALCKDEAGQRFADLRAGLPVNAFLPPAPFGDLPASTESWIPRSASPALSDIRLPDSPAPSEAEADATLLALQLPPPYNQLPPISAFIYPPAVLPFDSAPVALIQELSVRASSPEVPFRRPAPSRSTSPSDEELPPLQIDHDVNLEIHVSKQDYVDAGIPSSRHVRKEAPLNEPLDPLPNVPPATIVKKKASCYARKTVTRPTRIKFP